MRIAIDLDKTIFSYGPNWVIGEPVPGAIETIRELHAAEHHIVIFSARANLTHKGVPPGVAMREMEHALRDHEVPFHVVETGYHGKPLVDIFIDDKALGVPLIQFFPRHERKAQLVVNWVRVREMLVERGCL